MEPSVNKLPDDIRSLVDRQAEFIISQQLPSGAIPWYRGTIADPWDHVEAAMALDFAGRSDEASAAYRWLRDTQNPDGSWYFSYLDGTPEDLTRDSNFSTYVATGMWLNYLITGNAPFLREMWPVIQRGTEFALGLQQPSGEIYWGLSATGDVWPGAILTAASSTWLSLRCAARIAAAVGEDGTRWDAAGVRLSTAIKEHPELFDRMGEDKSGHGMTWYYPVLVGLLEGRQAEERINEGWKDFIIDGWGCKCFSDRQSVCVAETCELILALTRMGAKDRARMVLDWILQFRDSDGVFYRELYWPDRTIRLCEQGPQGRERNTWTSAAAILAAVALTRIDTVEPERWLVK